MCHEQTHGDDEAGDQVHAERVRVVDARATNAVETSPLAASVLGIDAEQRATQYMGEKEVSQALLRVDHAVHEPEGDQILQDPNTAVEVVG